MLRYWSWSKESRKEQNLKAPILEDRHTLTKCVSVQQETAQLKTSVVTGHQSLRVKWVNQTTNMVQKGTGSIPSPRPPLSSPLQPFHRMQCSEKGHPESDHRPFLSLIMWVSLLQVGFWTNANLTWIPAKYRHLLAPNVSENWQLWKWKLELGSGVMHL